MVTGDNVLSLTKKGLLIVITAGNYDKPTVKDVNGMLIDYIYPALQAEPKQIQHLK